MTTPNFWRDKRVLVTGGTGLVGSHVVERLLAAGASVIVTYRDIDKRSYFWTKGFEAKTVLAQCDINDYLRVLEIVSSHAVEYIFHLAAQPLVTVAQANPYGTLRTNILGTVNVLEAARHHSAVRGIIVASSDKAYGRSENLPYAETQPLAGDHPYTVSKSSADLIANMYHKTYDLPVVTTRFGNIYGPGDLNFNRLIPGAILAAVKKQTLAIRSDGNMLREFVYVSDVADGYLLLAENIEKTQGQAFNFGSGDRYRVLAVVEKIGEVFGQRIAFEIFNSAQNEIEEQFLSFEKVKSILGWEPKYTLDKALPETIKWYETILQD